MFEEYSCIAELINELNRIKLLGSGSLSYPKALYLLAKEIETMQEQIEFLTGCEVCAPPDEGITLSKDDLTFMIEKFLTFAVQSAECSLVEYQKEELLELWEKW